MHKLCLSRVLGVNPSLVAPDEEVVHRFHFSLLRIYSWFGLFYFQLPKDRSFTQKLETFRLEVKPLLRSIKMITTGPLELDHVEVSWFLDKSTMRVVSVMIKLLVVFSVHLLLISYVISHL